MTEMIMHNHQQMWWGAVLKDQCLVNINDNLPIVEFNRVEFVCTILFIIRLISVF